MKDLELCEEDESCRYEVRRKLDNFSRFARIRVLNLSFMSQLSLLPYMYATAILKAIHPLAFLTK